MLLKTFSGSTLIWSTTFNLFWYCSTMREKSFFGSGGGFIWKLIFMIAAPQTRENHTASIIEKLCNDTNVFTEQPQEAIVKPMEETLTLVFEPSNSKFLKMHFLGFFTAIWKKTKFSSREWRKGGKVMMPLLYLHLKGPRIIVGVHSKISRIMLFFSKHQTLK